MGRSAGPQEGRAQRTCSLLSKPCRAMEGQEHWVRSRELSEHQRGCYFTPWGRAFPTTGLFQLVAEAGTTLTFSCRPCKELLLGDARGPDAGDAGGPEAPPGTWNPRIPDAGLSPNPSPWKGLAPLQ